MDWQKRFKDHLADKGLSKTEIAARMGVTGGALGHWLSGFREINLSAFMKLCKVSEADPKAILFGEDSLITDIRKLVHPETTVSASISGEKPHINATAQNKHKKIKQLA